MYSYHDVTVIVDGTEYRIKNDYSLELTCTRVGGWSLWRNNGKQSTKIGGEYHGGSFQIKIGDIVICDSDASRKEEEEWMKSTRNTDYPPT